MIEISSLIFLMKLGATTTMVTKSCTTRISLNSKFVMREEKTQVAPINTSPTITKQTTNSISI